MKLIRILVGAIGVLLALTGAAAAEPISTAIGVIASTIASLGAFGQLAISLALSVGTSLLQRALQTKPRQAGIKADIDVGGDNPLSFIVGTYATAGQLEYVNTSGGGGKTPNEDLTLVVSLSDLPLNAVLPSFWVNGEKCTIDAVQDPGGRGNQVPQYRTGGDNNHLWVRPYDGRQASADPFLLARFGLDPERPWLGDMLGHGVAYAVVTAEIERTLFTGPPQCTFEVEGVRLYDPRKDSTVGGSGGHRFGNEATYEFTDNPAVIIYNILRGISYGDEWIFGLQNLPATRLPLSNWFAAMNECDRLIPLAGGGFERQFRCGAEIHVDEQPIHVIEELLKACNGRMAEIGGIYKIRVGAPTLPVYAFTDEAITITNGQSYNPFPGLESVYNGVNYSYPDPAAAWEMKDGPVRLNPDLEIADDGQRLMADADFNYVPFPVQAQRLAKALIDNNRRFASQKFTLPPEAYLLEPLDVVSYTSARNGYQDKLFDLESMDDLANVNQAVALKEVDPSDYDWNPGTDQKPTSIGVLGPIRPPAQLVTGWQVAPAIIRDAEGNARRPSIEVFFAGGQRDVDGIRVQVNLAADLSLSFDVSLPYDAPLDQPYSIVLNGVFLPNEDHVVRAMFTSKSDRLFDWTGYLPVRTPNVLLGAGDVFLPGQVEEVLAHLNEKLAWLETSAHYHRDVLDQADQLAAEQGAKAATDRREILAELGQNSARFSEEVRAVVTATDAIVVQVVELNATVFDPVTGLPGVANAVETLSAEVHDSDTGLEATASRVSALTATVGSVSAQGLFRTTVEAAQSGSQATIGLSVSATSGGITRQAALFLSAKSDGTSEVGITANTFYVVNGTQKRRPFIIQNGILFADELRVNTLSALSATLGVVDISQAVIGSLVVGTSNLGIDSVSRFAVVGGGLPTVATIPDMLAANRSFVQINWVGNFFGGGAGDSGRNFTVSVINNTTGGVIYSFTFHVNSGQTLGAGDLAFRFGGNVSGSNTFTLTLTQGTAGAVSNFSANMQFLYWKR